MFQVISEFLPYDHESRSIDSNFFGSCRYVGPSCTPTVQGDFTQFHCRTYNNFIYNEPPSKSCNDLLKNVTNHHHHPTPMSRSGNGGVKVREFVDIFCAHPPKPRQSGRRNQQNFTTPNAYNPTSGYKSHFNIPFFLSIFRMQER